MKVKSESEVAQSCLTCRTAAYQAPPSMGFSRQEYWSGVPLPSLGEAQEMSLKRSAVRDGESGFPIKLLPDNPSIANTSAQGKPPVTILRT